MANYIKGNLLNIFVSKKVGNNDPSWVYFGYTQSSGLTISNSLQEISSKDHGNYNDRILQSSTWSLNNEMFATIENLNLAISMAQSGEEYSFAFARVGEPESAGVTGLKPVTGVADTSVWTIGQDFVRYGNAIVSNAAITSNSGEVGSVSIEATGIGGLSSTAQTGDRLKSYVVTA